MTIQDRNKDQEWKRCKRFCIFAFLDFQDKPDYDPSGTWDLETSFREGLFDEKIGYGLWHERG